MEDYSNLQGLIAAAIETLEKVTQDANNLRWMVPVDENKKQGEGPVTFGALEAKEFHDTLEDIEHTLGRVVSALFTGMASTCPNAVAIDLLDRRSWQEQHYHEVRANQQIAAVRERFEATLAVEHQNMLRRLREQQQHHEAEMRAYRAECDRRMREEIDHRIGSWQQGKGKRMLRV